MNKLQDKYLKYKKKYLIFKGGSECSNPNPELPDFNPELPEETKFINPHKFNEYNKLLNKYYEEIENIKQIYNDIKIEYEQIINSINPFKLDNLVPFKFDTINSSKLDSINKLVIDFNLKLKVIETIQQEYKDIDTISSYVNEQEFFSISNANVVFNCKYKPIMVNMFGTCWFNSITLMIYFSDLSREFAQTNLLECIKKLKLYELSSKQNHLLGNIFPKEYFENKKLKPEYISILYDLCYNLYKNLFFMMECLLGKRNYYLKENFKCSFVIIAHLHKLFSYHGVEKQIDKEMKLILDYHKDTEIIDYTKWLNIHQTLGHFESHYTNFLKLYSIILLNTNIIYYPISYKTTYAYNTIIKKKTFKGKKELTNTNYKETHKYITYFFENPNILGYIITLPNHAMSIFKCNSKYYICDNNIIEFDIKDFFNYYDSKNTYILEIILNNNNYKELHYIFKKYYFINYDTLDNLDTDLNLKTYDIMFNSYIKDNDNLETFLKIYVKLLISQIIKNLNDDSRPNVLNIFNHNVFYQKPVFKYILCDLFIIYYILYQINILTKKVIFNFSKFLNLIKDKFELIIENKIYNLVNYPETFIKPKKEIYNKKKIAKDTFILSLRLPPNSDNSSPEIKKKIEEYDFNMSILEDQYNFHNYFFVLDNRKSTYFYYNLLYDHPMDELKLYYKNVCKLLMEEMDNVDGYENIINEIINENATEIKTKPTIQIHNNIFDFATDLLLSFDKK